MRPDRCCKNTHITTKQADPLFATEFSSDEFSYHELHSLIVKHVRTFFYSVLLESSSLPNAIPVEA
jgi:endonuclease III-like uncharacterized protein